MKCHSRSRATRCFVLAVLALAETRPAAAQRMLDRPHNGDGNGRGYSYSYGQKEQRPVDDRASPFDTAFRSLAAETLEAWHVPGVSVAVIDGDSTWAEGFGLASVQPETPMTADTMFYTASTTKAFLAAALSLIIDSGNHSVSANGRSAAPLDWSTPIADVLPDDFVLTMDAPWETAHITLEDALSHRTGLGSHDMARSRRYGLDPESLGRNATVRDVTRSLRHLPALHTSPRTEWRYCNLGFLVLAHVAETLTGGRWLGDTFREWIWEPLGMSSTFFNLDDARAAAADPSTAASLAQGYYWDVDDKSDYVAVPHMPLEEVSGAGGIISTVNDYAKWLRCWIDGPASSFDSSVCGGIPFSQAGFDAILTPKMFTTQTSASPKPFDAPVAYASAWTTSSYKGHRFYGHSGGSNAFGAQVYFFPEDRFGVVVFGNTAVTSNKVELILLWHLVDERFGIPKEQRHDWDSQFRRASAARRNRVETALDRLYPSAHRATPPLQPSLPLEAYTGTFHHPAYQNMTVRLAEAESKAGKTTGNYKNYEVTFTAERLLHTWPTLCEFVHVSGEHWFVYTDMVYEKSGNFRSYARAWFEVGADGRADRLMVEFWNADDDSIEGVIPFERVE